MQDLLRLFAFTTKSWVLRVVVLLLRQKGVVLFPLVTRIFQKKYSCHEGMCPTVDNQITHAYLPHSWYKIPNLVFESEHSSGGHFAAHEKPQELVGDLRKMFGKGGPAFGVVKGSNGYA